MNECSFIAGGLSMAMKEVGEAREIAERLTTEEAE
jgi:hypothetical protein